MSYWRLSSLFKRKHLPFHRKINCTAPSLKFVFLTNTRLISRILFIKGSVWWNFNTWWMHYILPKTLKSIPPCFQLDNEEGLIGLNQLLSVELWGRCNPPPVRPPPSPASPQLYFYSLLGLRLWRETYPGKLLAFFPTVALIDGHWLSHSLSCTSGGGGLKSVSPSNSLLWAFLRRCSGNRRFVEVKCRLHAGSEVQAFTETWLLQLILEYKALKQFFQLCLLTNGELFLGATLSSLAAYTSPPVHPLRPQRRHLHPSLCFAFFLSSHCVNWRSMVRAIVNMAVWDWYKRGTSHSPG